MTHLAKLALLPLLSALLLAGALAAQADDRANLLSGTWEIQEQDGDKDIKTFGPDKTFMHQIYSGEEVTTELSGTWVLDGDSIAITVEASDPPTAETGETLSYGLVSVTAKSLVLAIDGEETTAKRLSPPPAD